MLGDRWAQLVGDASGTGELDLVDHVFPSMVDLLRVPGLTGVADPDDFNHCASNAVIIAHKQEKVNSDISSIWRYS